MPILPAITELTMALPITQDERRQERLLSETTVTLSDSAGWSVTARVGEVHIWMDSELTLQPKDVGHFVAALNFAQRRAGGDAMLDHSW